MFFSGPWHELRASSGWRPQRSRRKPPMFAMWQRLPGICSALLEVSLPLRSSITMHFFMPWGWRSTLLAVWGRTAHSYVLFFSYCILSLLLGCFVDTSNYKAENSTLTESWSVGAYGRWGWSNIWPCGTQFSRILEPVKSALLIIDGIVQGHFTSFLNEIELTCINCSF